MPDITSDRVKLIVSLDPANPLNGTEQTAIAQAGITKKTTIADVGSYTKTLDYSTWVYANTGAMATVKSLTGNWNSVYSSVTGASAGWNYAYNNFVAPYTYVTNLTSNNDILSPHITLGNLSSAKYVDYSPLNIIDASTLSVFGSIRNTVASVSASSDLYLANDTGSDYLDIGVNSSQYDGTKYSPKFDIVKANDSYVYTLTANLAIGTGTNTGELLLFSGGTQASNERVRVTSTGKVGIGTSTPDALLTLSANNSFGGLHINQIGSGYGLRVDGNSTLNGAISSKTLIVDSLTASKVMSSIFYGSPGLNGLTDSGMTVGGIGGTINLTGGNGADDYGSPIYSGDGSGSPGGCINLRGGDGGLDGSSSPGGIIEMIGGGGGDGAAGCAGKIYGNAGDRGASAGIINISGSGSMGSGGSIITTGSGNYNGGDINTSASSNYNGGFIDTSATADNVGGYINTSSGGYINTSSSGGNINTSSSGGYITTSDNGGYINTSDNGGYIYTAASGGYITTSDNGGCINTSNGGGSINTTGTGNIQFGTDNTRTILRGSATSNRTVTLPDASGTISLEEYTRANFLPLSGGTLFGSLSTPSGTSVQWSSVYSRVCALSTNWSSVYSSFNSQSANNASVFATLQPQSANNLSVYSYVNSNTANWNSIGLLQALSANDKSVYSQVNLLSTNWSSVYATLQPQSANNLSVYSYVNSNTANWNSIGLLQALSANDKSVYSQVNLLSTNWGSVYSYVNSNTANWNSIGLLQSASANNASVYSYVNSNTANWNSAYQANSASSSVYSQVNLLSTNWGSVYSYVNSNTANWNSVYSSFNSQSSNNASVYSQVNSSSATWQSNGALGASSYTTLQAQSANNLSVYSFINNTTATTLNINNLLATGSLTANSQLVFPGPPTGKKIAFYNDINSFYNIGVEFNELRFSTSNVGKMSFFVNGYNGFEKARVDSNGLSVYGTLCATAYAGGNVPNWDSNYTSTQLASANNASVYSYVNSNTANWNSIGLLQALSANDKSVYSQVNSTSGNWNSNYTTVQTNSATWSANTLAPLNIQSGTAYTFTNADAGYTICSTNITTGLTASLGTGTYPDGFQVTLLQLGTQRIALSGGINGITINQADGLLKTNKRYSAATLLYTGSTGGWVLFGDLTV